ncbi:uncharacterized protein Z520_04041 [Fonsecaea multimorphosa CBS 102226]|uniref:Clr5 domain-containing protein n=1 Tax=Fonsecaea multimorphosa CBS 102226 TaxID=1442371 RepID=A0A0D2HEQ1_9EURO|nr:uncharacterized protein Z520_04041 [Fonsecaea multimorphosa CBS 102226]KIY00356.1 hypothetical protein Z520_04041 [Fonsecaea multimorphosa CBS 102226]OAL27188.1 hypothetical protein AYO22_03819 [Fonsecaea multimorphosa]
MPNPPVSRARTSTRATPSAVRKHNLPRKKGPSLEEWHRVKPLVQRYMAEGKKQKDILDLLSKEHQFQAASHMLKERLKQWGMKKNSTKEEHKARAKEAKRCADLGLALPSCMDTDGRPYAWDRVYRHFGSDPQYKCSWLQSDVGWKAMLSKVCLKVSPVDHRIELVLSEVRHHWCTTLERTERHSSVRAKRIAMMRAEADPREITLGFLTALQLFRGGDEAQAHGRQEMNNVGRNVQIALEQGEPSLLMEIIHMFTATAWARQPDMFVKVVRYVRNLSANTRSLGPRHPLTTVLDTLMHVGQDAELLDTFAELALKVMMDSAEAGGDRVKLDRDYICAVETNYISRVLSRLEWCDAKDLVETKFKHYRRTLGEHNRYTLSMQASLGRLYLKNASRAREAKETSNESMSRDQAEEIFLKLVKRGEQNFHDYSRNGIYIGAATDLARMYFATQEFDKAQDYYCKALVWTAIKFGRSHPYISVLLREFRALQKLGELGLVKVKMEGDEEEEDVQVVSIAKDDPKVQFDCPGLEACGESETPDGQIDVDYSHASFAMFGDDTFSQPGLDWLPDSTSGTVPAVNDGDEALPSVFLDSYMDTANQESWSETMQGGYDTSTWDFNAAAATDVSQNLSAPAISEGPAAGSPQDLSIFFQNDLPECNFDADDIEQLLNWQ